MDEIGSFSNALVIADPVTYDLAGNTIRSSLKGSKCTFYMISNASVEEVKKAESVLMKSNSDIVLGLGGGRPIDVAKLTAYRRGLPFISIPTSPSHDGIESD